MKISGDNFSTKYENCTTIRSSFTANFVFATHDFTPAGFETPMILIVDLLTSKQHC